MDAPAEGARPSDYAVDAERDAWETLQDVSAHAEMAVGISKAIFDAARKD